MLDDAARRMAVEQALARIQGMSHSELASMLDGQGKQWARLMLEENLRLRAQLEQETKVTGADDVERRRVRDSERHLETLLGRVAVPRLAYQAPGTTDLHPMDGALNLPREMFSHGVRRLVARQAATLSFDEVVDTVRELTGASVGKRQVEELAIRGSVEPRPRQRAPRRGARFPRLTHWP
jgi:hypothetical protein